MREVCARALTGMVQGMGGPPIYELLPKLEKLQALMTEAEAAEDRQKAHDDVEVRQCIRLLSHCVSAQTGNGPSLPLNPKQYKS